MNEEKYCTIDPLSLEKLGVDGHVWGIPDDKKFVKCKFCNQLRDGGYTYLNPNSPRVIKQMKEGFAIQFEYIHNTKDKVIKEVQSTLGNIPNIEIVLVIKQFESGQSPEGNSYWIPDWTTFIICC